VIRFVLRMGFRLRSFDDFNHTGDFLTGNPLHGDGRTGYLILIVRRHFTRVNRGMLFLCRIRMDSVALFRCVFFIVI